MGLTVAVAGATAAGLLFAARALLRAPKGDDSGRLKKDIPETRATRGTWIPILIGTAFVPAIIGAIGPPKIKKKSTGGGGKGGGGGDSPKKEIWFQDSWDILVYSPCSKLHEIRFNNKIIWTGPIDPVSTPSGTEVDAGKWGRFRIYWGEPDQPVNSDLNLMDNTIAISRHPGLCYVHWFEMRIGESPAHPNRTYLLESACEGTSLLNSDMVMEDENSRGINAAHVLFQLLTGPRHLGGGFDPSLLNIDSLEDFGVLAAAEHLPFNRLLSEGLTIDDVIQSILQDHGVAMPYIQGLLSFLSQRASASPVPDLSDDHVIPPDLGADIDRQPRPNDVLFEFDNEELDYRTADVPWAEDGVADLLNHVSAERTKITSVTHPIPASQIARRRSQEVYANAELPVTVVRGGPRLLPGQAFTRNNQRLRVLSVKPDLSDGSAELVASPDIYAVADVNDVIGTTGGDSVSLPIAADLAFSFFEVPPSLSSNSSIIVFRIRAHSQIIGANVYGAESGEGYLFLGSQDAPSQGGTLEEAILAGTEDVLVSGPQFEPLNDDMEDVLDLSGDTVAWQSGSQIAVINNEAFFVEGFDIVAESPWAASTAYSVGDFSSPTSATGLRYKVVASVGAGNSGASEPTWPSSAGEQISDGDLTWEARRFSYRPRNMIRARQESTQGAHSIGDILFVADSSDLVPISSSLVSPGTVLCVKTQPYNSSTEIDIASVTEVCKTISGLSEEAPIRVTSSGDTRRTSIGDLRITQSS